MSLFGLGEGEDHDVPNCDYSEDFGCDWIRIPGFQFAVRSRTRVFAVVFDARTRYKRVIVVQVVIERHIYLLGGL
jgi:hypothetical protein